MRTSRLARARRATTGRLGSGQSLVEFALVLPILLLMVLIVLDFGRVFSGWVALTNAARVGANFAAQNPTAWNPSNPNATLQAEYTAMVQKEANGAGCALRTPVAAPVMSSGTGIGSPATVSVTCDFGLITPIIGAVVGNPLAVSASAAFPIRAGSISNIPVATIAPYPTPVPTPTPTPEPTPTPTPGPTPTPEPTPTPIPTPTPTPTPVPTPTPCIVPNFIGTGTNQAQHDWTVAGFNTNVTFNPLVPKHYTIGSQTIAAGTPRDCAGTSITVTP